MSHNKNIQRQALLPDAKTSFKWPLSAAKTGDWKEASDRWSILRKVYPDQSATWVQGAYAHIQIGDIKQADILLSYAREHFPENPNTLLHSAELASYKGDIETARSFLHSAQEKHPTLMASWLKSTEYFLKWDDIEQAEYCNEQARKLANGNASPFIQYAEIAMSNERWELALIRWSKLRELFPEHPAGFLRATVAAKNLNDQELAKNLCLAHEYGIAILSHPPQKKEETSSTKQKENLPNLLLLIWTKTIFNLKSEIHRNYFGYGWWAFEPLLHMSVYYLVFGTLLNHGRENFSVFLLTGLIPWMWFNKSISSSSTSILAAQSLILQIGLPPIIFPMISLLENAIKQIPVILLLLTFISLNGFEANIYWWILIPLFLTQLLITAAFACLIAAIIPFLRDLTYLVGSGLTFLMFLSGIFYDYRTISPEWQNLFLLNPIAFLLKSYREVLLEASAPNLISLGLWALGSFISCAFLAVLYKRLRYTYPRVLLE